MTCPPDRPPTPSRLLVGLGTLGGGDDAVGLLVAEQVADLHLARVQVAVVEDPTALLDLWPGREVVVVVDAVCSGAAPGCLQLLSTGTGLAGLPGLATAVRSPGGTHGFGLAAVAELSRTLGRLPARLHVLGVEAQSFRTGAPLSPQVARALPAAVRAAADLLT